MFLHGSIYSLLLVRYSCLLPSEVLHALLCLKVYSWCIHGERCTPCPSTPLPSICQQICCLAFLPRSKCVLISWLQSPSTVIFEPKVIKSVTVSIVCPSICHEMTGPDSMIFALWMLSFNLAFSLYSFSFIKRLFSSSSLSAIRVVPSSYLRSLIFLPEILDMTEWLNWTEWVHS